MFKLFAGCLLFYCAIICHESGASQLAGNAIFLATFSIGAGLDSIFFNKR